MIEKLKWKMFHLLRVHHYLLMPVRREMLLHKGAKGNMSLPAFLYNGNF